jgi:hypothetical protein
MTPNLRKLVLTAHITFSVGWFGSAVAFVALSVANLTSQDGQTVRAAYLAMERIGWLVIVPFAIASLLSGLIQSLGTPWGLFKHYWVLAKLLITVFCTLILLMFMRNFSYSGGAAADSELSSGDLGELRKPEATLHATVGLLLLLAATTLSVYKPWGLTRYGQRKQQGQGPPHAVYGETRAPEISAGLSLEIKIVLAIITTIAVAFVVLHLTGISLGTHGH